MNGRPPLSPHSVGPIPATGIFTANGGVRHAPLRPPGAPLAPARTHTPLPHSAAYPPHSPFHQHVPSAYMPYIGVSHGQGAKYRGAQQPGYWHGLPPQTAHPPASPRVAHFSPPVSQMTRRRPSNSTVSSVGSDTDSFSGDLSSTPPQSRPHAMSEADGAYPVILGPHARHPQASLAAHNLHNPRLQPPGQRPGPLYDMRPRIPSHTDSPWQRHPYPADSGLRSLHRHSPDSLRALPARVVQGANLPSLNHYAVQRDWSSSALRGERSPPARARVQSGSPVAGVVTASGADAHPLLSRLGLIISGSKSSSGHHQETNTSSVSGVFQESDVSHQSFSRPLSPNHCKPINLSALCSLSLSLSHTHTHTHKSVSCICS